MLSSGSAWFIQIKIFFFTILLFCCSQKASGQETGEVFLQILGIAQDGGYPHAGCKRECCSTAWKNDSLSRFVTSFALVDASSKKWWLFEATPDIKFQLQYFQKLTGGSYTYLPEGIFITHAHIGHYSGLMQFGREVMNTKDVPVYVFPRMKLFLETNGPWSQLVNLGNLTLHALSEDSAVWLSDKIHVETFRVPHRDEFSETAGFRILTGIRKYLFIPDIDKWEKWSKRIEEEVKQVDVALLDGTFYEDNELPGRKISDVPHPFVSETMKLFKNESEVIKSKIFFIHFNHTNPLLWNKDAVMEFGKHGFHLAVQGGVL